LQRHIDRHVLVSARKVHHAERQPLFTTLAVTQSVARPLRLVNVDVGIVCLLLKVFNDSGEDVTPRPLMLVDPFSLYDSVGHGAGKIAKVPVCLEE